MVNAVTGFLTSDGHFFQTEKEARQYEATMRMKKVLADNDMSEDILSFLENHKLSIMDYLNPQVAKETDNERRDLLHAPKPKRV